MAIYADVKLGGGALRNGLRVPPMMFKIKLGTKGGTTMGWRPWSIPGAVPPKGLIGWAHGTKGLYKRDVAGFYGIYMDGKQILELRPSTNATSGYAFAALNEKRGEFELSGSWSSAAPPNSVYNGTWGGIMFKAAASAAGRIEAGAGALVNLADPSHGVGFVAGGLGGGISVGGSVGFALVLATGFPTAQSFDRFSGGGGFDWDLSFGPKWAGLVKGTAALPRIANAMHGVLENLEKVKQVERLQKLMRSEKDGAEIYSAAKGIYQAYWVDDEIKGMTAIDIPTAGGGAQIGIHYAWSGATRVSDW